MTAEWDNEITARVDAPMPIVALPTMPAVSFVASPHCNRIARQRTQVIVLHCTDGHEDDAKPGDAQNTRAEQVAVMFSRPDLTPKRSAHYVCDSDSIVQCVSDHHRAWAAGKHGNDLGIHLELCGLARQTRDQWLDPVSLAMLQRAARLVATLCSRHGLPRQFVPAADLLRGVKGITTHDEVRLAWKETTHRDPGQAFPLIDFVRTVQLAG